MDPTLDSATDGFSWNSFFNGVGGLFDKYANYRLVKSTDAIQREGKRLQADQAKAAALPDWVMPTAVLGAAALVVVLLVRR